MGERLRWRAFAAVVIALWAMAVPAAYDRDSDEPSVTDHTDLVDPGLMQVEFSAFYQRPGGAARAAGTPVTVRIGLFDWLEARVGTDGVISQTDGIARQTGAGNTSLGAMVGMGSKPGGAPVLAILPTVVFPTADPARGLGSGERDYVLVVLTGRDLSRRWHTDVTYGAGRFGAGEGQPRFTQHLVSVSLGFTATTRWSPYVDSTWFSAQGPQSGAVGGIDGGATYEIGPRYAVEGGIEFSGGRVSHEVTAFAGLSIVVGDVLGSHGVHARQRRIRRRRTRAR